MQRQDPTQNKLEIWYEAAGADVEIALTLPDGTSITLPVGLTREIAAEGCRIGIADHDRSIRKNLSCVRLVVDPRLLPSSLFNERSDHCAFNLGLRNSNRKACTVHAWVERDDGAAARSWLSPSHPEGSLCCLATIPGAVTVAGYDLDQDTGEVSLLPASSLGPAPWARGAAASRVPHFAAPAHGIWGARSKSRGFAQTTGTSAAVALTSGAIAAHLAANGAHAVLPAQTGNWTSRLGFGPFRIHQLTGAPA